MLPIRSNSPESRQPLPNASKIGQYRDRFSDHWSKSAAKTCSISLLECLFRNLAALPTSRTQKLQAPKTKTTRTDQHQCGSPYRRRTERTPPLLLQISKCRMATVFWFTVGIPDPLGFPGDSCGYRTFRPPVKQYPSGLLPLPDIRLRSSDLELNVSLELVEQRN